MQPIAASRSVRAVMGILSTGRPARSAAWLTRRTKKKTGRSTEREQARHCNKPESFFPTGLEFAMTHATSFFRLASWSTACLLYTSDAADERSSVDLGG